MIPRTWDCDLSAGERSDLVDLLHQSPGLWPFGIAAGTAGLDQAIDFCRDPSLITMNVEEKLRAAGFVPTACLLCYDDILAILMGIRVRARMRPRGERPPLQRVARGLGVDLKSAQAALRILHAHGTTPAYEALNL